MYYDLDEIDITEALFSLFLDELWLTGSSCMRETPSKQTATMNETSQTTGAI